VHHDANPYVGPRAFGEEDRGSFFGRDREIRELPGSRGLLVLAGS